MKLIIEDVTWIFSANNDERILGLKPNTQYGQPCEVTFIRNKFFAEGNFDNLNDKNFLITTDDSIEPEEKIISTFIDNVYDERFGIMPNTYIAKTKGKGTYTFKQADFGTRTVEQAIFGYPVTDADITIVLI